MDAETQSESSMNEQDPHPCLTSNSDTLINSDEYDFKTNSTVSFLKRLRLKQTFPLFLQQQKNWFIKRKQIVSNDMGI